MKYFKRKNTRFYQNCEKQILGFSYKCNKNPHITYPKNISSSFYFCIFVA